jgi:hypothetical protein
LVKPKPKHNQLMRLDQQIYSISLYFIYLFCLQDSIACSPDELFMDVQQQQNGPPEATSNTTITLNGERNNNDTMDEGREQDESGQHENLQQNVAQSALNFSQLLNQSGHGLQQTQQPPVMSAAAAAAAAAFQTLMPTQSQLHLMNQLAMASQLQQQQQQQGLGTIII